MRVDKIKYYKKKQKELKKVVKSSYFSKKQLDQFQKKNTPQKKQVVPRKTEKVRKNEFPFFEEK